MPIQRVTRPAATLTVVQWTGNNLAEIVELAGEELIGTASGFLTITIRGVPNVVKVGWWVYREAGRFAVCSDTVPQVEAWQPVA